jgi:hypothetical protein
MWFWQKKSPRLFGLDAFDKQRRTEQSEVGVHRDPRRGALFFLRLAMNTLVGQQNNTLESNHHVPSAGPALTDSPPTADTLPSSSPPPPAENDDENLSVEPSNTISPQALLDGSVAPTDDKDPPTVHTSELVKTDADEMMLDTSDTEPASDAHGGAVEDGQDWMPEGQDPEMKRVKARSILHFACGNCLFFVGLRARRTALG